MDRAMELGENLVRYGIKVDVYKPQLDNNENILFPSKKLKIKNKTYTFERFNSGMPLLC